MDNTRRDGLVMIKTNMIKAQGAVSRLNLILDEAERLTGSKWIYPDGPKANPEEHIVNSYLYDVEDMSKEIPDRIMVIQDRLEAVLRRLYGDEYTSPFTPEVTKSVAEAVAGKTVGYSR